MLKACKLRLTSSVCWGAGAAPMRLAAALAVFLTQLVLPATGVPSSPAPGPDTAGAGQKAVFLSNASHVLSNVSLTAAPAPSSAAAGRRPVPLTAGTHVLYNVSIFAEVGGPAPAPASAAGNRRTVSLSNGAPQHFFPPPGSLAPSWLG